MSMLGPDPFLHEEWAQSFADVMRGHEPDTYHAEQARAYRFTLARGAALSVRERAGDLADAIPDLRIEAHLKADLLEQVHRAQRTLAKAEEQVRALTPIDKDDA